MSAQPPEDEDILETARESPEEADVDQLVELLGNDTNQIRNVALMSLSYVAQDDPSRVVEHTDEIIERIDDEFPVAGSSALQVLAHIAPDHPEPVLPALPQLIDKLDEMPPLTGYRAGQALGALLQHDPEAFEPYTDDLIDILWQPPDPGLPRGEELREMPKEERQKVQDILESRGNDARKDVFRCWGIQEIAANALVEISEFNPDAVSHRIDEIAEALDAEPPIVQGATLDTIANVGEDDPEAVSHLVDDIVEMTQDGPTSIRAHAVQALGFIGATEAVDDLRAVADSDEREVTEDLAELAAETADFLEAEA